MFYEAFYYPEKQKPEHQNTVFQKKAELYRETIPERSFQVPLRLDELPANFDAPEEGLGRIPSRSYRSTYPFEFKQKYYFDNNPSYISRSEFRNHLPNFGATEVLNEIRPGDYTLRNQYPFREYNQAQYSQEYNLDNIKRIPISPNTIYMNNNINTRSFEPRGNNNIARRENFNSQMDFEDGSNFQGSFENPINHERSTFREFSSPTVTNEIRRGFEYGNLPIDTNRPVERGSVTEEFSRTYQNANLEEQNLEYDRLTGVPDAKMENIYEPRPQVIRYMFSNPRKNEFERLEKTREERTNLINDEVPNQGDAGAKREAGIASIEVSEVPRHKIRHHHGERPKRNYSRQ